MKIGKENLLEELQSIKHCLDMTNTNIEHQHTREHIVLCLRCGGMSHRNLGYRT